MSSLAPNRKPTGIRAFIRANYADQIRERMRLAFSRGHMERREEYKKRGATDKKALYYAGVHGLLLEAVEIMREYNEGCKGGCTKLVYEIFSDISKPTRPNKTKAVSYSRFTHIVKDIKNGADVYDIVADRRGGNNYHWETPVLRKWLKDLMMSGKAYSVPYMHKEIESQCKERGFRVPSISWVKDNYYQIMPCVEQFRYGKDKHHYNTMPYAGLIQAQHPDSQWQIDGWQLPFYMEGFKKLTLFVVKDACTRVIRGYSIGATENTDMILEALENAARTSGVLPREIVSDNHSFNKTKEAANLRDELEKWGCTWTITQNPRHKSIIERDFNTFGNQYCKPMPGYISEGVLSRRENGRTSQDLRDKYQRAGHWLTEEQIKLIAIKCVHDWNNQEHDGKQSRMAVYEAGESVGIDIQYYEAVALFVRATEATVRRGQINIERGGVLHEYQMNAADIAKYNGKKVTVRFSDYSQIFVFDNETDEYICMLSPKKHAHAALYEQTETDHNILMGQKSRLKGVLSAFEKQREGIDTAAASVAPGAAYDMNPKLMPKDLREDFMSKGTLALEAERLRIDVYTVPAYPDISEVPGMAGDAAHISQETSSKGKRTFKEKDLEPSIYKPITPTSN